MRCCAGLFPCTSVPTTKRGTADARKNRKVNFFDPTALVSAVAAACCAPALEAEVTANGVAGGPYSAELQAHSQSDTSGEVQRQVDIAVVSSALPIINPGLAMVLLTSR
jgi:hypothetical protein